jgi:hypothetical protein
MVEPCGTDARQRIASNPIAPIGLIDSNEVSLQAAHELSERLTALTNYLAAALRCREIDLPFAASRPLHIVMIEKAAAQIEAANAAIERLRHNLRANSVGCRARRGAAGPVYRVSFLNEFARNRAVLKACQRTIVIRLARSPERAIAAAQKRFARLEGIRDWTMRARFIEVDVLDEALPERRSETG